MINNWMNFSLKSKVYLHKLKESQQKCCMDECDIIYVSKIKVYQLYYNCNKVLYQFQLYNIVIEFFINYETITTRLATIYHHAELLQLTNFCCAVITCLQLIYFIAENSFLLIPFTYFALLPKPFSYGNHSVCSLNL